MKKTIAGNWKMHMTIPEAQRLAEQILATASLSTRVDVVLCPPFTALAAVAAAVRGAGIRVSAQNMHHESSGAFTGECSAAMLLDAGCSDVIIGHSERRHVFNETDEMIARKVPAAIASGLMPTLCVGETERERDLGLTFNVVERQVRIGLSAVKSGEKFIIAYEPVWAIGTGRTATPGQALEVHRMIRELLQKLYPGQAASVPVLYGGSVKPDNLEELLAQPDIDGALVGGASLKAESFNRLIEIAAR